MLIHEDFVIKLIASGHQTLNYIRPVQIFPNPTLDSGSTANTPANHELLLLTEFKDFPDRAQDSGDTDSS